MSRLARLGELETHLDFLIILIHPDDILISSNTQVTDSHLPTTIVLFLKGLALEIYEG